MDRQQFKNPDIKFIARKLLKPVLFDSRNLYDPTHVPYAYDLLHEESLIVTQRESHSKSS